MTIFSYSQTHTHTDTTPCAPNEAHHPPFYERTEFEERERENKMKRDK